jgi:hypothetical protein
MAIRFAVATGNFNNGAIWDNGVVPTSADDVFANGFTVTINGPYTVQTIRNTVSSVLVPNIATPAMTSNNTPSGLAFASSSNGGNIPWIAFNQDGPSATYWQSGTANSGILGYQFPSGKIIKRYSIRMNTLGIATYPTTWTFQGSNDGITYTTLETVTGVAISIGSSYVSGILANTTSYTYYRINITAVNTAGQLPTISEFEMTESTGTVLGATAGGQFIYANGGNLTCTAAQAIFAGSTTPVLEMTLASPNTAIFNGSVLTLTNTNNFNAIKLSGTGTLTCTGNYTVDNGAALKQIIFVTSTGTLNVIGNLSSTIASQAAATNALRIDGNATVNITGDITASAGITNAGGSATVFCNSNSTLNVTGNITGAANLAIYTIGSTVNIIGSITGGTTVPGLLNNTGAATISLTGVATSSATTPAIIASFAYTTNAASGTLVKVSGNPVNANGLMAIIASRITIDTATSSWLFQISTGGNRTLYAAGVALGNPATNNVRLGTIYGASNELTGTLIVPSPSNVLQGVGTDATVGTLLMTPAQFWNYLISSGFTPNSIGDRLQNASTVATTGGQIASYNI